MNLFFASPTTKLPYVKFFVPHRLAPMFFVDAARSAHTTVEHYTNGRFGSLFLTKFWSVRIFFW